MLKMYGATVAGKEERRYNTLMIKRIFGRFCFLAARDIVNPATDIPTAAKKLRLVSLLSLRYISFLFCFVTDI